MLRGRPLIVRWEQPYWGGLGLDGDLYRVCYERHWGSRLDFLSWKDGIKIASMKIQLSPDPVFRCLSTTFSVVDLPLSFSAKSFHQFLSPESLAPGKRIKLYINHIYISIALVM